MCYTKSHIHKLHINRHNKAVQEIRKFLISNIQSRCYILMNAGKTDEQPQENTVPHWLLPCTYINQSQRCQCNVKLRPDILCIHNHPYNAEPPNQPNSMLTVQFIEARGWKVDPLMVLSAGAQGSTHKNTISALKNLYTIPKTLIEPLVSQLNTNAIKYAMNILLYKTKLENNQLVLLIPHSTEYETNDKHLHNCNTKGSLC
jgi:hypothetical protein